MQRFDPRGTTALVTGASSGFGTEFARRFAERGADLVLVARRADRLAALAAELEAKYATRSTVVALDLTAPGATASLVKTLAETNVSISSLVNNAGFGSFGPVVETDAAELDGQVALDVAAVVSLTRAFLPQLLENGRGALVNVASTAAFQPVPRMAVYGASKAFVLNFTEALWHETKGSGLRVTALCPGPVATEFEERANNGPAMIGRWSTVERVVDTALHALDRKRTPPSIVSGRWNAVQAKATSFAPRRLLVDTVGRLTAPKS